MGESSLHVEKASSLNLTCILRTKGNDGDGDVIASAPPLSSPSSSSSAADAPKSRLRWYKDGKVRTIPGTDYRAGGHGLGWADLDLGCSPVCLLVLDHHCSCLRPKQVMEHSKSKSTQVQ